MRLFPVITLIGLCLPYRLVNGSVAGLSDPTRPTSHFGSGQANETSSDGFPVVKVSAVFIHGDSKHAVIDGKSWREGQTIRGFTLTEVNSSGIVLKGQEGSKNILINSNATIKKDASNDF